jgi:hypothetical protein
VHPAVPGSWIEQASVVLSQHAPVQGFGLQMPPAVYTLGEVHVEVEATYVHAPVVELQHEPIVALGQNGALALQVVEAPANCMVEPVQDVLKVTLHDPSFTQHAPVGGATHAKCWEVPGLTMPAVFAPSRFTVLPVVLLDWMPTVVLVVALSVVPYTRSKSFDPS